MLQRSCITITRGQVATTKPGHCGTKLSKTCLLKGPTSDIALARSFKDLVLRGWGNFGPRNRGVCLDGRATCNTHPEASESNQGSVGRDVHSRQREGRADRGPRES